MMSAVIDGRAFYSVAAYCLGSNAYKKEHAPRFVGAVESMPQHLLTGLLSKTGLAANVYFELYRLKGQSPFLKQVAAMVQFNRLLNQKILYCLKKIHPLFLTAGLRAVLLKGVSCSLSYYPAAYIRKSTDIDLLITNPRQVRQIGRLLLAAGFKAVDPDYERTINLPGEYGIPPFFMLHRLPFSRENKWLHQVYASGYGEDVLIREKDAYYLSTDIDLHRQLFLLQQGGAPVIRPSMLMPSIVNGYHQMSNAAALPYLASKFYNDIVLTRRGLKGYSGFLKLLNDFIRILRMATPVELRKAIKWAELWGCEPLIPELCMTDIPDSHLSFNLKKITHQLIIHHQRTTN
jgi:hypothetical protein